MTAEADSPDHILEIEDIETQAAICRLAERWQLTPGQTVKRLLLELGDSID